MSTARTAPYGEWKSPLTTDLMVAASVRLGNVAIDAEDIYWVEGRASESGRNVIVRRSPDGTVTDVTPPGFNVRTRAHEYGGGACLIRGGHIWFCNFDDQRIYYHAAGQHPEPLTPPGPYRYADLTLDRPRGRLICIREDHSGDHEPINELVAVDLVSGATTVLAGGHDFCSSPVINQEQCLIAWLTWDHPNMPWDETELWIAHVRENGSLDEPRRIAGGLGNSVFQPAWSPTGGLYFVDDPTGWWNLYRWDGDRASCISREEAEFGLPQWQFGMRTFGFDADGHLVTAYCEHGAWNLGLLDPSSGVLERLGVPHCDITSLAVSGCRAVFIGSTVHHPNEIVSVDLDSGDLDVLRSSSPITLDAGYVSMPHSIDFPTAGGATAHGFFYPPMNRDFRAPAGELPPLIVICHGGPTGATTPGFSLRVQYWTSRGFAVLDVNYRGSTGYGRGYRELLRGRWGIADVEDCVHGARYLADAGKADANRLIIRGSSAGGYTTLAALTFHDTFRAGASLYGIADLEMLIRDTHKFESRYLDRLIGPYPERRDLYRERSPIHAVDRLSCPIIFFQGLDDKVVPPNQAKSMVAALRAKGLPVAYLAFEGEQHGFRRAETVKRVLEAELYFYGRVFGFTPAGEIEPVLVENIESAE